MAICKNCGNNISDTEKFCTYCGQENTPVVNAYDTANNTGFNSQQSTYYNGQANCYNQYQQPIYPVQPQLNALSLVGFIMSIVMAFLGFFLCGMGILEIPSLVISIVGLVQIKKSNPPQSGKGFAIAGIIISSVVLVLSVLIVIGLLVGLSFLSADSSSVSHYSY